MRLMAMILVPGLLLVALEAALRTVGYGYPTSFFVPSTVDGTDYLIPNERFTHRFFPPAIARPVQPFRMRAVKPKGTYRIFVFGASAALGDPDPCYGASAQIKELLEAHYPTTEFEVVCVALTAINSHVVVPIARECARLDGDLWLVYLGNNEMVGPFGASTVFGKQAAPVGFVRANLLIKSTRLGQLFTSLLENHGAAPATWTGINMFKDNLLPHDDPTRTTVYTNFQKNLETLLDTAHTAGVPVLLSTVGSNLRDCSPFASLHPTDMPPESIQRWEAAFEQGRSLEKDGDVEQALACYRRAEAIDPTFAELQYRMGLCLLHAGQEDAARAALERARDLDALAVRADTRINAIIRSVADEAGDDVTAVDVAALTTQEGIPGTDWFYDHVHFTPEGNYRLARLIADRIDPLLPLAATHARTDAWVDLPECLQARALTTWDRLRLYFEMYQRLSAPPFDAQSCNASNKAFIADAMDVLKATVSDVTKVEDRDLYETALTRRPHDPSLIVNFAQFLDGNQLDDDALNYARRFRDLLPDSAWTHYYLGALLANNARYDEAQASLERALELRSDFAHAKQALKAVRLKRLSATPNPLFP